MPNFRTTSHIVHYNKAVVPNTSIVSKAYTVEYVTSFCQYARQQLREEG